MTISTYTVQEGQVDFVIDWPISKEKRYTASGLLLVAVPREGRYLDCKIWRGAILAFVFEMDMLMENGIWTAADNERWLLDPQIRGGKLHQQFYQLRGLYGIRWPEDPNAPCM